LTDAVEVSEQAIEGGSDEDLFVEQADPIIPVVAVEDTTNELETAPVQINQMATYEVRKNETLMIIAFNLYGDYRRWKELRDMNSGALNGKNDVYPGMEIKYMNPETTFEYQAQGNPYLIVRGDTLGLISNKTYGTKRYWKDIWKNNEVLIRDPNKIYAGFTIYTPEIAGPAVASQTK
jgi:nucleoid-associated protein YgaU